MVEKDVAKEYLRKCRNMNPADYSDSDVMSFTLDFCERHDLYDLFVQCKMNCVTLYAVCRYGAGEIGLDGLQSCAEIINAGISKRDGLLKGGE